MIVQLPLWLSLLMSALIVLAGLITLIGALGLLRFSDFSGRIHATTLGNTLGSLCLILAAIGLSFFLEDRVFFHQLILIGFIFIASPISSMLLMRSYILRQARRQAN